MTEKDLALGVISMFKPVIEDKLDQLQRHIEMTQECKDQFPEEYKIYQKETDLVAATLKELDKTVDEFLDGVADKDDITQEMTVLIAEAETAYQKFDEHFKAAKAAIADCPHMQAKTLKETV